MVRKCPSRRRRPKKKKEKNFFFYNESSLYRISCHPWSLRDLKQLLRSFVSRTSSRAATADVKPEKELKDFYISDYILAPSSDFKHATYIPSCPVIVFINSKSGGQLGGELLVTFQTLLDKNQVIDLGQNAPEKVLHQIYANLQTLKYSGNRLAVEIEKRLRIVVAGGDGTAGWLLGVVSDLKLPKPPPVATMPLGTGNNLPFSFGWGKKNPGTDSLSVVSFLEQLRTAEEMKIDSWHIIMRMKSPKDGSCDPIPLELPHSLHAFHHVSQSDSQNLDGYHTFRGGFWNYFSVGMDAQVSYAFHSERKLHPEKFKKQFVNQSTYLKLGCTQGWFCSPLFHPSSENISQLTRVRIMKRPGQWEDLSIPHSIRSIVCLNLPSFSGGLNPWGKPSGKKSQARDLKPPYVDDGLIEVVGFKNAWHGLVLITPNGHGTRLAQANRIRFEFHKGAANHTFIRIDGEPWKQPLPVDDDNVIVEISNRGQVGMLAVPGCRSKRINDPIARMSPDDESAEDWEERRKFGAAESFRC